MGAGVPGLPFIIYGRTKFGAFGVTALNSDISDIYEEKIDGNMYEYDGKWHEFKIRSEHFKVRFGSD